MEGIIFVVIDVDVNELEFDSWFYFIFWSCYRFFILSILFKFMVRFYEGMLVI